jgi:hypothetical protein
MRATRTRHVVLLLWGLLALMASCKRENRIWLYEPGGGERFERELQSGDPWERRLATLQIAWQSGGSTRDLPVLLAAARSGSQAEREAVYAALRVYREEAAEAVPLLIADLVSGPTSLRCAAALALASVGGSRRADAEPALLAARADPDGRVRMAAGIALDRLRAIVIVLSPLERKGSAPWDHECVRARIRADGIVFIRSRAHDLEDLRAHLLERAETLRDEQGFSGVTVRAVVDPDAPWIRVRAVLQICAHPDVRIHRIGIGGDEAWRNPERQIVVKPDPPPIFDIIPRPAPTELDRGDDDRLDDVPPPVEELPPIGEETESPDDDPPGCVMRISYDSEPLAVGAIGDRLRRSSVLTTRDPASWIALDVHPSVPATYVSAVLDRLALSGRHRVVFTDLPRGSPIIVEPAPDRAPGIRID